MRESRWARNGTPAVGSMGFGADRVSGRSRVPLPPTSTTASTSCSTRFSSGTGSGGSGSGRAQQRAERSRRAVAEVTAGGRAVGPRRRDVHDRGRGHVHGEPAGGGEAVREVQVVEAA